MRVDEADGNAQPLSDDLHRFGQVGIVGDQDGLLAVGLERISQHPGRQVDV
jgi:hypothetical protein